MSLLKVIEKLTHNILLIFKIFKQYINSCYILDFIVKFILYKLYVIKIFHITNYVFVLQLRINTLFKAHFT